jgi:hypothetical protein
MKIIKTIFLLFSFLSLISCGPNKEAEEKEKRKEDSLMEIERNTAISNAEQLLNDSTKTSDTSKFKKN